MVDVGRSTKRLVPLCLPSKPKTNSNYGNWLLPGKESSEVQRFCDSNARLYLSDSNKSRRDHTGQDDSTTTLGQVGSYSAKPHYDNFMLGQRRSENSARYGNRVLERLVPLEKRGHGACRRGECGRER